jgi:hypothetical protein
VARKFLYVMVVLIVLVIAGAFAYRFWGNDLIRLALVPGESFRAQPGVAANAYDDRRLWFARPDLPGNPTLWTPTGYAPAEPDTGAAVFFIHPTSYISRDHWNAPLNDPETNDRTALFLRGQASAFNEAGDVWAPRYRQATFGAFLTSAADAQAALDLAYRDVAAAFDSFLRAIGPTRPIILAGHSQGSIHLLRLLRERVATDPALRARIVAAYPVGWPISRTADLPRLGLPECASGTQTRCLLSWVTFAEPADPSLVTDHYDGTTGFDGAPRAGTPIVCTNPLVGLPDAVVPATANLGTLYPSADLSTAAITAGKVPARCGPRGLLLIGEPPAVGPYVLPGNNYHVYDYTLFWANVRADAVRRLKAFR